MDSGDRLKRLENALVDLLLVVTEGRVARSHFNINPAANAASRRLERFYGPRRPTGALVRSGHCWFGSGVDGRCPSSEEAP
jgi:hypothetical protein